MTRFLAPPPPSTPDGSTASPRNRSHRQSRIRTPLIVAGCAVVMALAAGCGGASSRSDDASADPSSPTSTQTGGQPSSAPFDERLAECEANLNVGIANVRAIPDLIAEAVIGASGPAQVAATLRAEADALSELIANQASRCRELLPECPDATDAWQTWAQQFIDGGLRSMADITLGTEGGYANVELPGEIPPSTC